MSEEYDDPLDQFAAPIRAPIDADLLTMRTTLEPALFAEAFAAGQAMLLAAALATILPSTYSEQG